MVGGIRFVWLEGYHCSKRLLARTYGSTEVMNSPPFHRKLKASFKFQQIEHPRLCVVHFFGPKLSGIQDVESSHFSACSLLYLSYLLSSFLVCFDEGMVVVLITHRGTGKSLR